MKTVDFSGMIVMYNFVIGVLLMFASEKIVALPARFAGLGGGKVERYGRVSCFTLGACIASVAGFVYVAFHILRIGVD